MKKFYLIFMYPAKTTAVCLLFGMILQMVLPNTLFGQDRTVTGTVTSSEDGEAIPGVLVLEKNTNNGTVSNEEGRYSIQAPQGAVLVFSSVGFVTGEITVDARSVIDVQLALDIQSLGEVVVVGYGTQERETLTGSIVNVEGKTLEQNPALSLSNSMAGRLPGLQALNRSGEPGSDVAQLLIRGSSTMGSSAPLIVIDGVPGREGFDQIDPRDVESVSILKDASAAIYGSRAANGVIIITTKRGSTGKPSITYSFNQGITTPTRIPEYADSETLAQFQNEQLLAQGQSERFRRGDPKIS